LRLRSNENARMDENPFNAPQSPPGERTSYQRGRSLNHAANAIVAITLTSIVLVRLFVIPDNIDAQQRSYVIMGNFAVAFVAFGVARHLRRKGQKLMAQDPSSPATHS
jgi:hypothetical protein